MSERTALLAGGTGLVGNLLLGELLDAGWRVIAVSRRSLGRTHERLSEQIVDFAALGPGTPLPRADAAFSCLGTTIKKAGSQAAFRAVDLDAVVHFAQAARAGGTERFLTVSSHGADPRSRTFYLRVKGEAEETLRGLGFSSLALARPSLLLGERAESRPAERVASLLSKVVNPVVPLAVRPIEAATVARALRLAAERPTDGVLDNARLHQLGTVSR